MKRTVLKSVMSCYLLESALWDLNQQRLKNVLECSNRSRETRLDTNCEDVFELCTFESSSGSRTNSGSFEQRLDIITLIASHISRRTFLVGKSARTFLVTHVCLCVVWTWTYTLRELTFLNQNSTEVMLCFVPYEPCVILLTSVEFWG